MLTSVPLIAQAMIHRVQQTHHLTPLSHLLLAMEATWPAKHISTVAIPMSMSKRITDLRIPPFRLENHPDNYIHVPIQSDARTINACQPHTNVSLSRLFGDSIPIAIKNQRQDIVSQALTADFKAFHSYI